jgi:hypothetical protein
MTFITLVYAHNIKSIGHIWICTYHSIHDRSNHSCGFTHQVSKTPESWFNLFHAARTFLVISILNFIQYFIYVHWHNHICTSICLHRHRYPIFWFCLSLSLKFLANASIFIISDEIKLFNNFITGNIPTMRCLLQPLKFACLFSILWIYKTHWTMSCTCPR